MSNQNINGSQKEQVQIKKKKSKDPFVIEKKEQQKIFDCLIRKNKQQQKNKEEALRNVAIDTQKLPQQLPENLAFTTNRISTTKYNQQALNFQLQSVTFLPKSLIIQFLRVSNVYFLISAILASIPGFSPLPSYTGIAPLVFVLVMSMMREAYEDYKRRVHDRLTNNKKARVFNGKHIGQDQKRNHNQQYNFDNQNQLAPVLEESQRTLPSFKTMFQEQKWADIKCGDILLIEEGEHFPADMVILLSSAENGEFFVQTSSLDGERALKHKQCLVPIKKVIERQGLMDFHCSIHCEPPSKNLYEFNAFMETDQFPESGTVQLNPESKKRTITLDNKQLALRGSNLANTEWVIGVIAYSGKETKLMLNYGLSRFKQSKIEKVVNVICVYLIILEAALCLYMSIFSGFFTEDYASLSSDGLTRKAEYIFYTPFQTNGQGTNFIAYNSLTYNPTVIGVETFGAYFLLLNTLIPISLVVSIEFVKLIQTSFFEHDLNMYDEESMKQAQPVSMTLHEELASVKYIFADKTGTLTANVMQFKACSIGSVCYDEDYNEDDYEYEIQESSLSHIKVNSASNEFHKQEKNEKEEMRGDGEIKALEFEQFKENKGYPFNSSDGVSKINKNESLTKIVWNFKQSTQIIKNLLETKKYFMNEEINLGRSQYNSEDLILKNQNDYLHYFWLNVVLCHDVITTKKTGSDELAYQGTSPDEITLLDAAKEVGYIFLDRNSDSMKIEIFGKNKDFKLLQKLEFSSERKKMSIVVQDSDTGYIFLLTKGADLAIFDKLSTTLDQPFLEATKEDLIKFSTKGFRTLCFAMKIIDEPYFQDWKFRYENSKLDMIKLGLNKLKQEISYENLSEKLQNELEKDLFLLGATALEDKLQDGVPEAIEDFHNAGIKVWMLTGDKLETAENIGFSSKMFNEKMYIFKLQTQTKDETKERLKQIEQKIQEIEKFHAIPIVGTQFILNPNAGFDFSQIRDQQQGNFGINEARNIIRALEEYKHESRVSEFTLNDSWTRKPILKRKVRKRLEEIVPDKQAIVAKIIKENQIFHKDQSDHLKYIPRTFDMQSKQYLVRQSNVYRSSSSLKKKQQNRDVIDDEDTFGILVEGQALHFLIDSLSLRRKFLSILAKCQAVIVCRASPSQKGLVVNMIQKSEPEVITLAIGDGANDVNMIQKAHIGVGIFGKEGYQAASNSDYAIGQFRFLRRLMFVHGRWSGVRLSFFMLFFFHKNIVFTMQQFWFGLYCGYSGQTFFDDMYITCFNTFVTALAICGLAISDQDVNVEDSRVKELIEIFFPFIYKETQENDLFTKKKFLVWLVASILQSILLFGVPIVTYNTLMIDGGKIEDLWAVSTCSYFAVVFLHYLLIFYVTCNWTIWIAFMYFISFLFFIPFVVFTYNYAFLDTPMTYRIVEIAFSNAYFWIMILCVVGCSLVPIVFYYTAKALLFPSLKEIILQRRLDKNQIIHELDPIRTKQTHDLFKQKQQEQLHKWNSEYNGFDVVKSPLKIKGDIFELATPDKDFINIPQGESLQPSSNFSSKLKKSSERKNHGSNNTTLRKGKSKQKNQNPFHKPEFSKSFELKYPTQLDLGINDSHHSENLGNQSEISESQNLHSRLRNYSDINGVAKKKKVKEASQIPLSSERENPSKIINTLNVLPTV